MFKLEITVEPRGGNVPVTDLKNETSTFGKFWANELRNFDKAGYKITLAKEVTNDIVLATDIHALT